MSLTESVTHRPMVLLLVFAVAIVSVVVLVMWLVSSHRANAIPVSGTHLSPAQIRELPTGHAGAARLKDHLITNVGGFKNLPEWRSLPYEQRMVWVAMTGHVVLVTRGLDAYQTSVVANPATPTFSEINDLYTELQAEDLAQHFRTLQDVKKPSEVLAFDEKTRALHDGFLPRLDAYVQSHAEELAKTP